MIQRLFKSFCSSFRLQNEKILAQQFHEVTAHVRFIFYHQYLRTITRASIILLHDLNIVQLQTPALFCMPMPKLYIIFFHVYRFFKGEILLRRTHELKCYTGSFSELTIHSNRPPHVLRQFFY